MADYELRFAPAVTDEFRPEGEKNATPLCDVYWGSHGCYRDRGHDGPHECYCCDCENHPDPGSGCVAKPPYYGPDTRFYGDDAEEL